MGGFEGGWRCRECGGVRVRRGVGRGWRVNLWGVGMREIVWESLGGEVGVCVFGNGVGNRGRLRR